MTDDEFKDYIIKRIERIENHQLQIGVPEHAADIVKRIEEISNYECHNRALIDELQKDLPMRIQERVEKLEKENLMRQDTIASIDSAYDKVCDDLDKRIVKLEGHYYSEGDLSAIHGQLDNINKNNEFTDNEIKRLTDIVIELQRFQDVTHQQYQKIIRKTEPNDPIPIELQLHDIEQKIACLFTSLKGVETKFGMINSFNPMRPYRCPLCEGKGRTYIDPNAPLSGFEAMFAPKDEKGLPYRDCSACENKGIVWG